MIVPNVDPFDKRSACEEDYVSPPWQGQDEVTSSSDVTSSSATSDPFVL